MAHNRYPNRRWMFLTSGDAATGVNFNQVMETSPATCRYNIAPTDRDHKLGARNKFTVASPP